MATGLPRTAFHQSTGKQTNEQKNNVKSIINAYKLITLIISVPKPIIQDCSYLTALQMGGNFAKLCASVLEN